MGRGRGGDNLGSRWWTSMAGWVWRTLGCVQQRWLGGGDLVADTPGNESSFRTSQAAHLTPSSDHNNLDVLIFSKDRADTCEFMQEKQLFPSSFKTCDLNLVGASDVNENHDADPILVFPSVTQTGKTALPIDVDLSVGKNGNTPDKFSKHIVNEKGIEVIELENDFVHEGKTFCNPDRRGDAAFTDLDGFSNNSSGMPDVQDGYGHQNFLEMPAQIIWDYKTQRELFLDDDAWAG